LFDGVVYCDFVGDEVVVVDDCCIEYFFFVVWIDCDDFVLEEVVDGYDF